MLYRTRALIALLALTSVAACDDDDDDDENINRALVRFVNATNTAIDVTNSGSLTGGFTNVGFGTQLSCITVNTTGEAGTGLQFFPANTSTALPFTQDLDAGGNYTIVAIPGATAGTTQFVTLDNTGFTPGSNQAGIRLFNGVLTAGGWQLRQGTTTIGATATAGTANAFSGVTYGANQSFTINSATSGNTLATLNNVNLSLGTNNTVVGGTPAAGTTAIRPIFSSGC